MPKGIYKRTKKRRGHIAWNKGLKGKQKWHNISGLRSDNWLGKKRKDMEGVNHFAWKGDKGSYRTKHLWIVNNFGQPTTCEHCNKENLYGHEIHWANISGHYKREKTDWIRLCAKCHGIFDKNNGSRKRIHQLVNL